MAGIDLKLDDSDGIKGEDIGFSLDAKGKPHDGQDAGQEGVYLNIAGKGDWDEPSYWRKVGRAIRNFINGGN